MVSPKTRSHPAAAFAGSHPILISVSIDADNIPDEGVTPGSADLTYQGDGNFHFQLENAQVLQ